MNFERHILHLFEFLSEKLDQFFGLGELECSRRSKLVARPDYDFFPVILHQNELETLRTRFAFVYGKTRLVQTFGESFHKSFLQSKRMLGVDSSGGAVFNANLHPSHDDFRGFRSGVRQC